MTGLAEAEAERRREARALAVRRLDALAGASMLPGSSDKRFVKDVRERLLEPGKELTGRQAHFLERLAWKYRRQLPGTLTPRADPGKVFPGDRIKVGTKDLVALEEARRRRERGW